ncbi:MAG: hypothetical protein MI700_13150 [Balneolales bacterium]|nr:hypothetical protein [Balneolales bacterium]
MSKKIAEFKSFTARSIINHLKKQNELGALNHFKNSKLKHKADREFQVWTEGFHPKQIIDEKMIVQKIEYIHYNPVRAGLVKKALDWEFSSARFYEGFESLISLTNFRDMDAPTQSIGAR